MTEAQWRDCTDYLAMLIFVRGPISAACDGSLPVPGLHCPAGYLCEGPPASVSRRRLRRLAASLARLGLAGALDQASHAVLSAYECCAHVDASWEKFRQHGLQIEAARLGRKNPAAAELAVQWTDTPCGIGRLCMDLAHALASQAAGQPATDEEDAFRRTWSSDPVWNRVREEIEASYPALIREVCGNPFRPAGGHEWGSPTVLSLAHAFDEAETFELLPVLADALEEAGCDNLEILDHCRGPSRHVRGCWVIDLILDSSRAETCARQ